jgi:membrane protein
VHGDEKGKERPRPGCAAHLEWAQRFRDRTEPLKETLRQWVADKAPQLGVALAYYTVFSLAPLILVLLAVLGLIFRHDPAGAWQRLNEQLRYFLDRSALDVIHQIAQKASKPDKSIWATAIGVALALFGASGVFGQLQDSLNTIWGVKPTPGGGIWGFVRTRFLSFAMVGGICFLLLISMTVEGLLNSLAIMCRRCYPAAPWSP